MRIHVINKFEIEENRNKFIQKRKNAIMRAIVQAYTTIHNIDAIKNYNDRQDICYRVAGYAECLVSGNFRLFDALESQGYDCLFAFLQKYANTPVKYLWKFEVQTKLEFVCNLLQVDMNSDALYRVKDYVDLDSVIANYNQKTNHKVNMFGNYIVTEYNETSEWWDSVIDSLTE